MLSLKSSIEEALLCNEVKAIVVNGMHKILTFVIQGTLWYTYNMINNELIE